MKSVQYMRCKDSTHTRRSSYLYKDIARIDQAMISDLAVGTCEAQAEQNNPYIADVQDSPTNNQLQ